MAFPKSISLIMDSYGPYGEIEGGVFEVPQLRNSVEKVVTEEEE